MKQETYSEIRGTVRIHENVIATIVRKMACSVKGVSKISGSSFVDNIAEMVGSKKIHDRSIVVEMGESSVSVEVSINLYYGVSLASAVQEAISGEIARLTGLKVGRVNIVVREIEDPEEEEQEEN